MRCLPPMRLMVLRVIINQLKNVENCQKSENCLSFENSLNSKNRLIQEKNRQKMGIYLISTLKKTGQAF